VSSMSEPSPEVRFLLLKTAVMMVALAVVFVLRCRVGELCGVDGRREPKKPFRLPRNHAFEGELINLEEGEPSEG